jgi:hypothetical protein
MVDDTRQSVASVLDLIRMAEASHATGGRCFLPALDAVLDARRLRPNRSSPTTAPKARPPYRQG